MKNLANSVVTIILTFVATLVLNFVVEIFTQNKGEVMIGPAYSIEGRVYVPLDISNFAEEQLNDFIISIPTSANAQEIISSGPVQIQETRDTVGTSNKKRIKLSGLDASQVTRLLVPVGNHNEVDFVQAVNARSIKLSAAPIKNISNPTKSALIGASLTAAINTTFYAMLMLWLYGQISDYSEKLEKAKKESSDEREKLKKDISEESEKLKKDSFEESEKLKKRLDDLQKEAEHFRSTAMKLKVLLLARLSDYSKELSFWRDTIRKVLYETRDGKVSESLINQVTASLKTYSTRSKAADDFETITALAGILASPSESKVNVD